jgi:hypothetical protein
METYSKVLRAGTVLPAIVLWLFVVLSANAQGAFVQPQFAAPVTLVADAPPAVNPTILPTDVTPISRGAERAALSREMRFSLMKKLPTRLWFSLSAEVSQRYESNVFLTYSHHKGDYVYRTLPNITLGYNILPHTSVYCNYFVIKDEFAIHNLLSFPTNQSLSLGVRHDVQIGRKTSAQFDLQARELWQSSHLRQFDYLPSLNLSHSLRPDTTLFGSLVLQMRGRNYFVAPTRELDPFYTIGAIYQKGRWAFLATDTFVTNFRSPPFNYAIPKQGNVNMISDFEISHPVINKIPGLVAFVRVEPVWNWSSHKQTGLSGFDIRVFGGLRLSVNKQSYLASIDNLRQQLMEQEKDKLQKQPATPQQPTPSSYAPAKSSPIPLAVALKTSGKLEEPITMVLRQPPPVLTQEDMVKDGVPGAGTSISMPPSLF